MVVFLAIQMYVPIHIGRQTFKITWNAWVYLELLSFWFPRITLLNSANAACNRYHQSFQFRKPWLCCDRKSRAACAQSFAPWQQARIEIMLAISLRVCLSLRSIVHKSISAVSTSQSLLLLLARATYIMMLFFTHIPFVVNHTINATPPETLQQYYH